MALRGALGATFNVSYGLLLVVFLFSLLYSVSKLGTLSTEEVLLASGGFAVGALAGIPVYLMNRSAVDELYEALDGKFFLSSQLALLDSRHGKNAFACFYFLLFLITQAVLVLHDISPWIFGYLAAGTYLSGHICPFVMAWRRRSPR